MKIYYLYAYATHDLLYFTHDRKQYEKIWDFYESNGVMCYGQDSDAIINNIKIEQNELEELGV